MLAFAGVSFAGNLLSGVAVIRALFWMAIAITREPIRAKTQPDHVFAIALTLLLIGFGWWVTAAAWLIGTVAQLFVKVAPAPAAAT